MSASSGGPPRTDELPQRRAGLLPQRRIQRGWYLYDCGVSGFSTVVTVVFYGPYLSDVARGAVESDGQLRAAGVSLSPGSVFPYAIALSVLLQVILVPLLGRLVDRTGRLRGTLAILVATGSLAIAASVTVAHGRWFASALLFVVATLAQGGSAALYNALLPQVAGVEERGRVSARGFSVGFLGAAVLLAADIALVLSAESIGLSESGAARLGVLSGGLWWAVWTVACLAAMREFHPAARQSGPVSPQHDPVMPQRDPVTPAQVPDAYRSLAPSSTRSAARGALDIARALPQTWLFLLAYVLYNDGVQTVMALAVVYGADELLLDDGTLGIAVLVVLLVAAAGGVALGSIATRWGARRTLLSCVAAWTVLIAAAYVLPVGQAVPFLALSACIGLILGGTQALSRSIFSHLIPAGREAAFFGLYQISDRGTSWLGPLAFGVTYQLTGSYRQAIAALVIFFAAGFVVLLRVNLSRAITDAGNALPAGL